MKYWLKLRCIGLLLPVLLLAFAQAEGGDEKRGVSVDTRLDSVAPNADELGEYHAFIIGINDYQKWPSLKFAYQDAEDLRSILISRYRFEAKNVSFLGNKEATLSNIISVLTRLLSSLTPNDNLLIYYAGHGQLDPLTDSGYWIPVDGEIYDETSWIRFSTITEKITSQNVKLKNILLITDSCYGGALNRSGPTPGKANPDADGEQKYLNSLSAIAGKSSRQVVASGGFEEVPDKSVFAELLKHNLSKNRLPMIDVEYMFFKNVLPELIKVGTQRPGISKLASGLKIDGQFIFALRESELDPVDTALTDLGTPSDVQESEAELPSIIEVEPLKPKIESGAVKSADTVGGDHHLYALTDIGDLLWYHHDGRGDGSFKWAFDAGKKVGNGWNFRQVFSGGDGIIYALTVAGDLLWYRHDGRGDGSFKWAYDAGKKVGNGWKFRQVFSGGDGVIYAVTNDGDLLWYRHDGRIDGSMRWAFDTGKKVGNGWKFMQVFSGGDGVIYAVTNDGDLLWYRHDGRIDGSMRWAFDTGKKVGNGWNFRQVFSGGDGIIYALTVAGDLLWYRHDGRGDGSFTWAFDTGKKVGYGWNFRQVFSD